MRRENPVEAQCEGKHRFPSGLEAGRVVRRSNRARGGPRRQAYRCNVCGGWHIGSTVGKIMRDRLLEKLALDAELDDEVPA